MNDRKIDDRKIEGVLVSKCGELRWRRLGLTQRARRTLRIWLAVAAGAGNESGFIAEEGDEEWEET